MSSGREKGTVVGYGNLRFTSHVKDTVASVFGRGRYSPPINALLEFPDNAVANRNRPDEGSDPTVIDLRVDRNTVKCRDFGGFGGDDSTIQRFVAVGESDHKGISRRGAGAKAAAWFLGRDIRIEAQRPGSNRVFSADIDGFGDPEQPYEGTFPITSRPSELGSDKGQFIVTVTNVKEPGRLPTTPAIKRALEETYRPLLMRDEKDVKRTVVEIKDGKPALETVYDKVDMAVVTGRRHLRRNRIKPFNIPLAPGFSEDDLSIALTDEGEPILHWAGEIDLHAPDSRHVAPGIRTYFDGRLVDIAHLGLDLRDPHLRALTGEAHLDRIRGIKDALHVNKSAGVNTETEAWRRVDSTLRLALDPLIQKLQAREVMVEAKLSPTIQKALDDARRFADLAFRDLGDITFETKGGIDPLLTGRYGDPVDGEGFDDREEPEDGIVDIVAPEPTVTRPRPSLPPPHPKPDLAPTAPRERNGGKLRKSFISRVEFAQLPDEVISQVRMEKDARGEERRVLLLNPNNPSVRGAQLRGPLSLTRLTGHELVDHMSRACLASEGSNDIGRFEETKRRLRFIFDRQILTRIEAERIINSQT